MSPVFLAFLQQDQYNMLEYAMSSMAGGFDPSSNLYYSQASLMGLSGSHGNLQDPLHMKANMLYSNCGGAVPNIILTGKVCYRKQPVQETLLKLSQHSVKGILQCF